MSGTAWIDGFIWVTFHAGGLQFQQGEECSGIYGAQTPTRMMRGLSPQRAIARDDSLRLRLVA